MRRRREVLHALLGAAATASAGAASGAEGEFPSRPIQLVVPFPAGGGLDVATRIVEPHLSRALGVPLVVVNRPGAGGAIALGSVLSSAADGYTLASTFTTAITLARAFNANVRYSPDDFAAIGSFAVDLTALLVRTSSPWRTADDLFADAARRPGRITCGTSGVGSVSGVALEAVNLAKGIEIVNVPFGGSPPAVTAVVGEQIDAATANLSVALPMIQAGKLRVLAVSGRDRVASFPDVATLRELGIPIGTDLSLKAGLFAAARTPSSILKKLAAAFSEAAHNPDVSARLGQVGLLPFIETAEAASAALQAEDRAFSDLARSLPRPQ